MSLPHMNWRYVGTRTFTPASIAAVLDELYTLGTSSTYEDGTARTQGSGSAGTWSKVQVSGVTECLHVTPAVNALNTRIMFGGATYTPSPPPTMLSPDTYLASTIMVNLVKNAGANFTTWNSSTPFTSGQTLGWGKLWQTINGVGNVYLWEAKEAVAILITGTSTYGCIAGAILDPESADSTTDGESDGRLYGIIRTGTGTGIATTFYTASTGSRFLDDSGANNSFGAAVFNPGAASAVVMRSMFAFAAAPSANTLRTRSGLLARVPIIMRATSLDCVLGRLREVYMYSDAQTPARQTDGSSVIGYAFSGSNSSAVDSLLLEHA